MSKVLGWTGAVLGGAVALLALMHVFISPINPKQEAPDVHIESTCWACHTVSESIEIKDLEEAEK